MPTSRSSQAETSLRAVRARLLVVLLGLGLLGCGPVHDETKIVFSEAPAAAARVAGLAAKPAVGRVAVGRLTVSAPKAGDRLFKLVFTESGRVAGISTGPTVRGSNTYYAESDLEPWLRDRLDRVVESDPRSGIELIAEPRFRLTIETGRGSVVERRTASVRLDLVLQATDQGIVVFDKTIKTSADEDISLAWGLYPSQELVHDLMGRSLEKALARLAEDGEFNGMGTAL